MICLLVFSFAPKLTLKSINLGPFFITVMIMLLIDYVNAASSKIDDSDRNLSSIISDQSLCFAYEDGVKNDK